jgi:hypothetical protein
MHYLHHAHYRHSSARAQDVLAGRLQSNDEIERALAEHEKFRRLTKEKVITSAQPKEFSQKLKQWKFLTDALALAFVCHICGAKVDRKSMQLDRETEKSFGGLADGENAKWAHP